MDITLLAVTIVGFLAIFLVATLLTLPFRRGEGESIIKQDASRQESGGISLMLGFVSRPLAVLLLTWGYFQLISLVPSLAGNITIQPRYLQAWYLFWIILLLFNLHEGVGRLYYQIRKRKYPVHDFFLFLLRLLLIGGTLFAIFHFFLDFDTSNLLTSTAVIAAIVGIAMREVLGHILAGLSMSLVGTFEPSQWIAIGDKEGEIIHRNWRETRIRTTGGHIHILPNSAVAGSILNNMTWGSPLRRHHLSFTLAFGATPQEVRNALLAGVMSVDAVDKVFKKPDVLIGEFREYGVVWKVRFWSNTFFDRSRIESDVFERCWYQLRRHGIEIPFPEGGTLSVFPDEAKRLSPPAIPAETILEKLQTCGFPARYLSDPQGKPLLSREQLLEFAADLSLKVYGPGEVILHQNQPGDSCLILVRGKLLGRSQLGGTSHFREFELEAGELFGEMALLAGLPRTATILVREEESELLEVSAKSFSRLLAMHPAVFEVISALVAHRSREMMEELQFLESQGHETHSQVREESIVQRLRMFIKKYREGGAE